MSTPPLVPLNDSTMQGWQRKVRDAINALLNSRAGVGATGERPVTPSIGWQFYDQSLGKPIWWDGATWRDATGGAV
jgi:hypothetical protein